MSNIKPRKNWDRYSDQTSPKDFRCHFLLSLKSNSPRHSERK
jgi:hypothetical protein